LVIYGKADGFLMMRPKGNAIIDFFFAGITHLGDGWAAVLLSFVFIFRKKFGTAFVLFSGYAVSGLISQAMKHSLEMPRPAPYFQSLGKTIHPIVGVELLQSNTSFPSGHSATAFALATALVLMNQWWRKKWWLALLLAVLVGYSRTYLGQHFLQDVLAGSVLGVMSTIVMYMLFLRWNPGFARAEGRPPKL
jgi:membrane-associated phospholipid phosphatase